MMKPKADLIYAVKNLDPQAMDALLALYDDYITELSLMEYTDKFGQRRKVVNDELKNHLQATLLLKIEKFDLERGLAE